MRAPLVETEQDGSIRIQDLTKVVMGRKRLRLAKERLVPPKAPGHISHANDRPSALHDLLDSLTRHRSATCLHFLLSTFTFLLFHG